MKQYVIICLLAITVIFFGCGEDEDIISYMGIKDFQIHVSDFDKDITFGDEKGFGIDHENSEFFSVSILVSSGIGGCTGYEQTRIFHEGFEYDIHELNWYYAFQSTWLPGDTINIQVTQSDPAPGAFVCTDDYIDWYQAVFVGFFSPGEYTIVVNGFSKTLTIDETDGTFHVTEGTVVDPGPIL